MEHTNLGNLGSILKAARKSRKLTRKKISESVGISVRYLSALENEHKIPSLNLLYRLVRALGMSVDNKAEADVVLNAVAAIQRVIRLMAVSPQIVSGFCVFVRIPA